MEGAFVPLIFRWDKLGDCGVAEMVSSRYIIALTGRQAAMLSVIDQQALRKNKDELKTKRLQELADIIDGALDGDDKI